MPTQLVSLDLRGHPSAGEVLARIRNESKQSLCEEIRCLRIAEFLWPRMWLGIRIRRRSFAGRRGECSHRRGGVRDPLREAAAPEPLTVAGAASGPPQDM